VAGSADRVVPLRDVTEVRSLLPRHEYRQIENAEHNLLLTHSALVTSVLPPPHPATRWERSLNACKKAPCAGLWAPYNPAERVRRTWSGGAAM